MLCSPSIGNLAPALPSRYVLNWGTPHMNTNTEKMIHGVHATSTFPCTRAAPPVPVVGCRAPGGTASLLLSAGEVQMTLGFQTLRKPTRQAMETIEPSTSTSHGP